MSRIEQLIGEIEEYIDSCKYQPLSNTRIIVNKEELEELLMELRLRIPEEIKQYQKIISNQEAIINEAQNQADSMIQKASSEADTMIQSATNKADTMIQEATAQTTEMVNEHEIMQRAYAEANEVVNQANAQAQSIIDSAVNDANAIRQGAMQYTDDMLRTMQNILSHTMDEAQGRFAQFTSSLQSSYDIVSSNRKELEPSLGQSAGENAEQ